MATFDSNRQTARIHGVLGNATNYIGLSKIDRKLFETQFPSFQKPQELLFLKNTQKPDSEIHRKRTVIPAWDLRVTGANLLISAIPQDLAKTAQVKIRTGQFYDLKKGACTLSSLSPMRKRGKIESFGLCLPHPVEKERVDQMRERIRRSCPRSISVAPDEGSQFRDSRNNSNPDLSSKSSLLVKTIAYSARKEIAFTKRAKIREASSITVPRTRLKRGVIKVMSSRCKSGSKEESPTKKIYKRMLQRTSEQIERENLQGWD